MIEAMKQALEALEVEQAVYLRAKLPVPEYLTKAITSLRQAIEQAEEQEPVKMFAYNCLCGRTMKFESVNGIVAPQREWVGLTDEEIKEIIGPWGDTPIKGYTRKLFDQIEAKLRSKNT